MEIPAADLSRIRELYAQGRYRQALERSAPFGPLVAWSNTPARLLAGRLAMQLGAPRLGRKLHAAAYRSTPSNLEAVYYHARYRFEKFGPLAAWRFMVKQDDWSDASPDLRADWHAFNAFVLARLRDFDRALRGLERAEELAPRRAWIQVERAAVLETADRTDDSLAAARRALELQPWFRPAVQAVAHLLQKSGRDAEAAAFLETALPHLESGIVWAHLASLQLELARPEAALLSLDRYAELSPLLETDGRKWLAARRADAFHAMGRCAEAAGHTAELDDEFHRRFTENLRSGAAGDRRAVKISIEAPTADEPPSVSELLAIHWNHPIPQIGPESPQAPDGLPDAAERRRIEEAGWVCREFTLTADAAAELLAAGLPFLLALVEVGVSQTRLVVGHDPVRESLFLRDGHETRTIEAPLAVILKRFGATGPRAMVVVPESRRERLNPFAILPDSEGYDRLYRIHRLMADGRQVDAKSACDSFVAEYCGHRLAKVAALLWARSTAHPVLALEALDELLADFPDDSTLVLAKAGVLRELGRTAERRAALAMASAKPDADPLIVQSYAQMLLADHRMQAEAERLLRRSIRARPQAAAGYFLLASQTWERGERAEALDLYRFACCLDDREEQFAEAYFRVAKFRGQAPEAIRLFQRRATRSDVPFPPAVRSLVNALIEREEPEQAQAALDTAIDRLSAAPVEPHHARPRDGTVRSDAALAELLIFRAESHARRRDFASATADLDRARPLAAPTAWRRAAARIARLKLDPDETLDHLKAALAADPGWQDGHRMAVGAYVESHGMIAARAYVGELVNRLPHSYPIVRLRAELLSPLPDDAAIHSVRCVIDLCPNDAWARRQLALVLADRQRDSEALEQILAAGEYEPDHPSHFAVLGHVHRRADRIDDAMETYRDALRRDSDHELAANELVRLARGQAERKENLQFIVERLHDSPHTGDGLVAYRDLMLTIASEEEENDELIEDLHRELERILDERPDLWQAWSLLVQQLGLMQRLEEARALAEDATDRFPLIAQLWSDLARVHGAADNSDERIEALRTAVAVSPDFGPVALELAEALAETGEEDESVAVLERAAERNPHDANTHAALADRLWNAGRSDEAIERAKIAVRIEPGFEAAWRMILHWSDRVDRPGEVVELARELTRTRPGDARGWLKLSRLLHEPEQNAEALAALETVIRLDPLNVEAHDQKAERLADMGRFDEAIEAAHPGELAEDLPFVLQGRAAWVEAKRGNYSRAIPPMQRLVSVEPEYFWGWQQLAEWYNETDRKDEYLDATGELVRLKPDHPMPLTMRGEAKLKTHDRAGGKADLRDALRLAPQYAPAAAILFDACLADGEIRDARMALAVLQEHAAGPEVLVKQVQLACRTDDSESALRTLAELAAAPGEGPPVAMQLALADIEASGWDERASRVLRDAFGAGDEPFNPWAPLFWIDTTAGEEAGIDERLAAVETAIRHHAAFAPAHDRKAELLVSVGRFEEAAAACRAPALGDPPPLTLRGRAAWVEAKRGHRPKAIALMKEVVASDPGYLWGWRNLAQWYDAEGRKKECLDASEQMVRLAPDDPVAYGYRGEARKALGDRPGAKADFAKAFDLDPRFDAAGLHLVAEQLDANEIDAAGRTLARVRENADGPLVKLRAVEVAAKQGDLAAARSRFRTLASDTGTPAPLLRDAAAALDRQGWTDRRIARGRETDVLESLAEIYSRNPDAGREATLGYAIAMAAHGQPEKTATTVHRFADQLRGDVDSWAKAGAALADAKLHALAASWLADWTQRDGVDAGMVRALAESLRAQDRDVEAAEVARAAVGLPGSPLAHADHRGWLALDAAIAGRGEDAASLLGAIERLGLPDRIRLVVAVAEAVVMVQRAGPDAKASAFAEAKEHLAVAAGACAPGEVPPGLPRRYRQAVRRIAADAGGFAAKLWAWWQQTRPWVK
jgi:cellulose synthase operon protein C